MSLRKSKKEALHYGKLGSIDMDTPPEKIKPLDPLKWILVYGMSAMLLSVIWVIAFPKEGDFMINRKTDNNDEGGKETKVDSWYSSNDRNYDCEYELKQKLGDPNSYSRSGGFNSINDLGNEKQIVWKYRAKNAYGGYILNNGVCTIYKDGEIIRITAMDGFNFNN